MLKDLGSLFLCRECQTVGLRVNSFAKLKSEFLSVTFSVDPQWTWWSKQCHAAGFAVVSFSDHGWRTFRFRNLVLWKIFFFSLMIYWPPRCREESSSELLRLWRTQGWWNSCRERSVWVSSFGPAGEDRSRQSGFVTGAPGACCANRGPIIGFWRFGESCTRYHLPRKSGSWYQQQRDSGTPAATSQQP